jgi:Phosphotransferase enzyme family
MSAALPTLADLTPGWIEALLRAQGVDADVSTVDARPIGTGQVGATYRLALNYSGASDGLPASLVAKLPSNDPLSKATGKSHLTYLRESRFYQHFAGKKPLPVPDHLFIAFDEETHDFALVMHDLPRHRAGNQLEATSLVQAQQAVTAAAAIHAAWWDDPLLDTLDWLNGTKAVPPPLDVEVLYTMFWPAFVDRYGDRVSPDMRKVGEAYFGRINAWADGRTGPRCLTHGDFRPDNMLFDLADPQKPIVIVDWQTVGVGSGAGDLAYFMGTALDPEMRQAEEAALFGLYGDTLAAHGVPEKDRVDLWDHCRASAFAGFLMGVTASMVVQQTERGDEMFLTMCRRSAAMVLDHADIALPA